MKYSTRNLSELPRTLAFPIKVIVEYRPNGCSHDCGPIEYTTEPEAYADRIVAERGWDRIDGYSSKDVWVDGGF